MMNMRSHLEPLDIAIRGLTKDYGNGPVVDDLTFTAPAGTVTGFVGANGAGKTTTMRMLLGLVTPTAGEGLIGGRRYVTFAEPRRAAGAVLDGPGAHPGHTGRDHLAIIATAARIPLSRVDEVLEIVDLTEHAGRRVGGYSLGMGQRLALAGALLADPQVLVLDEPANGLDPAGIRWIRGLLRSLAAEGRTVLVSSHLLSELAETIDRVVMIDRGRLIADTTLDGLLDARSTSVEVRSPRLPALAALLSARGARLEDAADEALIVSGLTAAEVGEVAAGAGIPLHALGETEQHLEDIYLEMAGTPASPATSEKETGR